MKEINNIGTREGDADEITKIKRFNKNNKNSYYQNYTTGKNIFLARVTTRQFSKVSEKTVMTKSDAFAIEIHSNQLFDEMVNNDYLIDENILSRYSNNDYTTIMQTGISMKISNSRYSIQKMTPNHFKKLFKNTVLAAGASLYVSNKEDLQKNIDVIIGWKTTTDEFIKYYEEFNVTMQDITHNTDKMKQVKEFAEKKIYETIDNSETLQKIIFNGIDVFDEPYAAHWYYEGNDIVPLKKLPYIITTGSGRSKGKYTLVIKRP